MSSIIQNILILGGLLLLVAFGYYVYLQGGFGLSVSDTDPVTLQNQRNTQEFLVRLNELKTIDVNTDLFARQRFQDLQDNSSPLPLFPTGRTNPFAAVRGD